MRRALALLLLSAIGVAHAGPSPAASSLDDVRAAATDCPADAGHCLGLVIHVAPGPDGGLVQSPAWIASQVARANQLFAPLGVGFTIADVRALARREAIVLTRSQRSRLGRSRVRRGLVHVFVVERLGNIDDSGTDINGVHWRRGAGHWIIVGAKAWELTLGHELGHFFGLPHSDVDASIMDTTTRRRPAEGRAFQPDELAAMRATMTRMLRDRALRDHAVPAAPTPPPPARR